MNKTSQCFLLISLGKHVLSADEWKRKQRHKQTDISSGKMKLNDILYIKQQKHCNFPNINHDTP